MWSRRSTLLLFQTADGIRRLYVTGVQTCALPIYPPPQQAAPGFRRAREPARERGGSAAQLAGEADGGTAVRRFLGRARPVAGRQRLGLLRRRRLRSALLEPR